jgi:hexosaminidase
VSIGADEYDADLADDYNNFVNEMVIVLWISHCGRLTHGHQSEFIGQWNKTIRIWGTNEPSNKTSVSKNITIQHWYIVQAARYS